MNISDSMPAPARFRSFDAGSPGEARVAASLWLGDFQQHGPLDIRSLRVIPNNDRFLAVLTYSDMAPYVPGDAPAAGVRSA